MLREQSYGLSVKSPDRSLQDPHQLRASQSPALAQHAIVNILNTHARYAKYEIKRIEEFLQVNEFGLKTRIVLLKSLFNGGGGAAMSPACIEIDERYALHRLDIFIAFFKR